MNRVTGEIISEAEAMEANANFPGIAIPMTIQPTDRQVAKRKVGKYDPCPCGSGKKFKWCCLLTLDAR